VAPEAKAHEAAAQEWRSSLLSPRGQGTATQHGAQGV
jgi:hypothetical protein